MKPAGHTAVMNQRSEALDAADDFPTPPWATRALAQSVLPTLGLALEGARVWEPAAGRGLGRGAMERTRRGAAGLGNH